MSRDLEIWVRGHSRSLKLVPIESLGMVPYSTSIVTMACLVLFRRYSEILVENPDFLIPPAFVAPLRGSRQNIAKPFGTKKKLRASLPDDKKALMICLAVSIEYRRVTDGRTDRRTDILQRHSPHYA